MELEEQSSFLGDVFVIQAIIDKMVRASQYQRCSWSAGTGATSCIRLGITDVSWFCCFDVVG